MIDAILSLWLLTCCEHFNVDYKFARAVMLVESGGRCGPLGRAKKVYGPMGVHRDFLKRWPISNPFINVQVGVAALRGQDKRRVLKRYNTAFNEAYFNAVMAAYRRHK